MNGTDARVVDAYDTALFDLDGVIYLGQLAVPAAAPTCAELSAGGTRLGFVTNNASRTPEVVAEHLVELGVAATSTDIVTSAQAVARLVAERVQPGDPVLVLGAPALVDEVVATSGARPVSSADDNPVAVVQGLAPSMTWDDLCEATVAIHRGATWFAANTDTTRPTDRGNLPGCGAAVAALRLAVGIDPIVAGKPFQPLMRAALDRLGSSRAIFVGDRFDTDIAGAVAVSIDSLFVFSGAHGLGDLLAAGRDRRPSHIGADVAALLLPPRRAVARDGAVHCGSASVREVGGRFEVTGPTATAQEWLDATWALALSCWNAADSGRTVDAAAAVAMLGSHPAPALSHTVTAPTS